MPERLDPVSAFMRPFVDTILSTHFQTNQEASNYCCSMLLCANDIGMVDLEPDPDGFSLKVLQPQLETTMDHFSSN